MGTVKRISGKRKRSFIRVDQDEGRKQVIVPEPEKVEDHHGGGHRFQKRKNDQEKRLHTVAAVKRGGFLESNRHIRNNEAVVHENGHRGAGADVQVNENPFGVQQTERSVDGNKRNHDGLERDDHGNDQYHEDHFAQSAFVPREVIGGHGREDHYQSHADDRNEHRVPDGMKEVHSLYGVRKVGKRQGFRKGERVVENIRIVLEGVQQHRDKRHHDKQKKDREDHEF